MSQGSECNLACGKCIIPIIICCVHCKIAHSGKVWVMETLLLHFIKDNVMLYK